MMCVGETNHKRHTHTTCIHIDTYHGYRDIYIEKYTHTYYAHVHRYVCVPYI